MAGKSRAVKKARSSGSAPLALSTAATGAGGLPRAARTASSAASPSRDDVPLARSVPAPFSTTSAFARSSRMRRWSVAEPMPRSVPSITLLPSADITTLAKTYGRSGGGGGSSSAA